jgi:hypothetical protein
MTGVLCLAYLCRMIPVGRKWLPYAAPAAAYIVIMKLGGFTDFLPAVGLALGGGAAVFLPPKPELSHRRGETGMAQVRLELMAGVLAQTQQLLIESPGIPIDEEAMLVRAQERACGGCPCRKSCRERLESLPRQLLHRPMMDTASLPLSCKKPGRLILEVRRSQEQLRAIKADRERQSEYRAALVQQYRFMGSYLQDLSDELSRRTRDWGQRFKPKVAFCGNREPDENGDRCLSFPGVGGRYYVAICDGMGTGIGAVDEGKQAASLLKRLLTAGFPAEYVLQTLNSLCALRGRAGAVTVDLAELHLDSGKVVLYKWGAAPSYLLTSYGYEKIGTAGPPPGLSVHAGQESVLRLSLRRGELLAMVSDGVGGEDALHWDAGAAEKPLGEIGAAILERSAVTGADDATVAIIRLDPTGLST